jgi:hypothetical protein
MNCFNHPERVAVAQCVDCGKGLCIECATVYKTPICVTCRRERRRKSIVSYALPLCVYTVLFVLGYRWNFFATADQPDAHVLSGYVLMSLISGYQFINAIAPIKMVSGDGTSWLIYYVFKFVLYLAAGFFTAPFTIGWNLFKFIRSLVK